MDPVNVPAKFFPTKKIPWLNRGWLNHAFGYGSTIWLTMVEPYPKTWFNHGTFLIGEV